MAEVINDSELNEVSGGAAYSGPCQRITIQPGDTLSALAVKYGTTVSVLAQMNNISNPNYIKAYDKLLVPYKK